MTPSRDRGSSGSGRGAKRDLASRKTNGERANSHARHQRRRRIVSRTLGLLFILFLVGALIWALSPSPIPVEIAVVTRGPLQVTVDEDGFTRIRDRYSVTTPQAGFLERITLRAGDPVEQGQVVARLSPPVSNLLDPRSREEAQARLGAAQATLRQAQAAVERARAAHALARQELQRQQSLANQRATTERELEQSRSEERQSRAELESARFAVQVAEEQVAQARAALERAQGTDPDAEVAEAIEIRSPVTGTVLTVQRESAGSVTMGEPLLEVGNLAGLEVVVDVLTTEAAAIEPGDPVALVRWGGGLLMARQSSNSGATGQSAPGDSGASDSGAGDSGKGDSGTDDSGSAASGESGDGDDLADAPATGPGQDSTTAHAIPGRVRLVEPSGFTKTSALGVDEQRVNVIIDFEDPPERRPPLGDGYRVEARIVVWEDDDVVQVPPGAVYRLDGGWGAFIVSDGRAHLREVDIGQRGDTAYQVLSGLEPGDEIILYPSDDVEDGVRVQRRRR